MRLVAMSSGRRSGSRYLMNRDPTTLSTWIPAWRSSSRASGSLELDCEVAAADVADDTAADAAAAADGGDDDNDGDWAAGALDDNDVDDNEGAERLEALPRVLPRAATPPAVGVLPVLLLGMNDSWPALSGTTAIMTSNTSLNSA
jgi:hypothetical protein